MWDVRSGSNYDRKWRTLQFPGKIEIVQTLEEVSEKRALKEIEVTTLITKFLNVNTFAGSIAQVFVPTT